MKRMKFIALLLVFLLAFATPLSVFAEPEEDTSEQQEVVQDSIVDENDAVVSSVDEVDEATASADAEDEIDDEEDEEEIDISSLQVFDAPSLLSLGDTDDDGIAIQSDEDEVTNVAMIGEIGYETIEAAIAAAVSGDTITLLTDVATVKAINPGEKVLTFDLAGHTLTNNYAFTVSADMTFSGGNVVVDDFTTSASIVVTLKAGSLNLTNSASMTIDGKNVSRQMIGFYSNKSNVAVNVTDNSTLTVKGLGVSGGKWWNNCFIIDGGSGHQVNITDGATVDLSTSYAGFTGTWKVTVDDANLVVHDMRGNGSNGSNYYFTDAVVNYTNNGAHGLSASDLIVTNSTVNAEGNTYCGIVGRNIQIDGTSTVLCEGNAKSTAVGAFRVMGSTGKCTIADGAKVDIINNYMSGIQVDDAKGTLDIQSTDVRITGNGISAVTDPEGASSNGYGGGIRCKGTATLVDGVVLYNNHATDAGDDIYVYAGGSITIGNTGADWVLGDCEHPIDGWYEDGAAPADVPMPLADTEEESAVSGPMRWAVTATSCGAEEDHYEIVEAGEYSGETALKAAHGAPHTIVVEYYNKNTGEAIADAVQVVNGEVDYFTNGESYDIAELVNKTIDGYDWVEFTNDDELGATGTISLDDPAEIVFKVYYTPVSLPHTDPPETTPTTAPTEAPTTLPHTDGPATGDNSPIVSYAVIMGVAVVAMVSVIVIRKKKA